MPCLSERRFLTAERTHQLNSSFGFLAIYISQSLIRSFWPIRIMNNSICGSQQQNSSFKLTQVEDPLHSAIIANIVFNGCLCYATVMLNVITIYALRRTSALSKPLKTFLLSLAVSDLGVGLLGQPLYIAYLAALLRSNLSNHTSLVACTRAVVNVVCLSSLFSLMALGTERFIAIQKPLRYQDIVTQKLVSRMAITIWLSGTFLGLSFEILVPLNIGVISIAIIESLCFVATTSSSYRIYLTVRHHNKQMQAQVQQVSQNSDTVKMSGFRKSARSTLWMYLAFWVCYLPRYFIWIVSQIQTSKSITIDILDMSSLTFVFLNSSINPIIYCWTMRHIRHTIVAILRNIFRKQ